MNELISAYFILHAEEEETNDEDDLYSDLAHTSESFEKVNQLTTKYRSFFTF